MSSTNLGVTQDQIMHAMQTRLAVKRESISKWRARYSQSEYPKRMAANLIGADIMNIRLAKRAPDLFRQGQSNPKPLEQALKAATAESSSLHRDVATRVDQRMSGQISSLEPEFQENVYQALISAANAGSRGDNVAVEKIEYNWVYNALITDLMEFWIGFGLAGLDKRRAFSEAFYFVQTDPDLSSTDGIRGTFHSIAGAILSAPGAYRQAPDLW